MIHPHFNCLRLASLRKHRCLYYFFNGQASNGTQLSIWYSAEYHSLNYRVLLEKTRIFADIFHEFFRKNSCFSFEKRKTAVHSYTKQVGTFQH